MQSFEHTWIRRVKWLTQALIVSVTLNAGLIATFVTWILKEQETAVSLELKPKEHTAATPELTNEQLLRAYSILSFPELQLRLEDTELIENGFTKRDLALACLAAFHHVNVERALGPIKEQKRHLVFTNQEGGEKIDLPLFAGLEDYQYAAVIHYLKTEKWPFTSQGLFFEIQRSSYPKDPSLLEAFYLTDEFLTVLALFTKTGVSIDKQKLVQLLAEGKWNTLAEFTTKQKEQLDLSCEKRRVFLASYLTHHSKEAAELLLQYDREFALKRLDDAHTLLILDLLKDTAVLLEPFAKELLLSPRGSAVWKQAATFLYGLTGEVPLEPYDHIATLRKFCPDKLQQVHAANAAKIAPLSAKPTASIKEKGKKKTHVVQEGESLWKIAKKYKVSVEALMQCNHLESEKLRVGKELEIPQGK